MVMSDNKDQARQRIREIVEHTPPESNLADFFEAIYTTANGNADGVPWADLQPHPLALDWLRQHNIAGTGKSALVVGCGLGDDAEELARRGFRVTAFDISPRAIAWCQERFPASPVHYQVADLFAMPAEWRQAFDFVLEIYIVQAIPPPLHTRAMASIASFVVPGGQLLVICRARESHEDASSIPWPLTRSELTDFEQAGLREVMLEDVGTGDGRHFRVVYER
jgi:2-polyprenyl-3-methyl-5-hydroxy-6-metoxy-1,4-benzoquinol methylase